MIVNTIQGGRSAFNTMLYNVPDSNTLNWLNSNMNRAKAALTGIADGLVDTTVSLYNKVNGNACINAAKALVTDMGGHTNQYMIYGLNAENMTSANFVMQQYIMANPVVQGMYADNLCHGFEETYYNTQPGVTGEDRLDYQRVMDGVMHVEGDDMVVRHYSNTDDVELPTVDKFLVLETWEHLECMLLNDMDPTDPNVA